MKKFLVLNLLLLISYSIYPYEILQSGNGTSYINSKTSYVNSRSSYYSNSNYPTYKSNNSELIQDFNIDISNILNDISIFNIKITNTPFSKNQNYSVNYNTNYIVNDSSINNIGGMLKSNGNGYDDHGNGNGNGYDDHGNGNGHDDHGNGNGNGHDDHGNGNGNGHDDHSPIPITFDNDSFIFLIILLRIYIYIKIKKKKITNISI